MKIPLNVLMIIDSSDESEVILNELRKRDYEPVWIRVNGKNELEDALKKQEWELVICDYNLSGLDSRSVLSLIRGKEVNIPFILVSEKVSENIVVNAIKSGANDFIAKSNISRLGFVVQKELKDLELKKKQAISENELLQRTQEISRLYDAGVRIGNSLDLDTLFRNTYKIVKEFIEFDDFIISSYNPLEKLIRCDYFMHQDVLVDVKTLPPLPLDPKGFGTQSDVIYTRKSILISDFSETINRVERKYYLDTEGNIKKGISEDEELYECAIMVPLLYQDEVLGVLQVLGGNTKSYNKNHLKFLEAFSPQIAAAIANAKLYQQAQKEIEDRKKAESALRLTRFSVDKASDAVTWVDGNGKFIDVNISACKLFGLSKTDFLKSSVWDFDISSTSETWQVFLKKLRQTGTDLSETIIKSKDGKLIPIEILANYIVFEGVEYIVAFVRDIRERKNTEDELRNKSREIESLYQSGIRLGNSLDLSTIFENTHQVIKNRIPCNDFIISTFDPAENLISCAFASHDGTPVDVKDFPRIPLEPEGKGTQSRVIRDGISRLMNNYQAELKNCDTNYTYDEKGIITDKVSESGNFTQSAILVALKIKNEVLGVLQVMSLKKDAYKESDLKFLEALSPQIAAAIQNAYLYQQTQTENAERKKALIAFQVSEHKYRQLFESIPNPVLISDRNSLEILHVNEAAINIYGYSYEEFLKLKLLDIRPVEDIPILRKVLKEHDFSETYRGEARHSKKDGSVMNVAITSYPMNYDGIDALVALVNDVTEKKLAEEEIKKTKEQLQNIFDNLNNVFWSADIINHKTLQMSPACFKVYGFTSEEFFNNPDLWFERIHPDDKHLIKENENKMLSGNVYTSRMRIIHKNNETRWIEISIKTTINSAGKIERVDGVTTDITERIKSEDALIKSEERFKQLSENAGEWIWEVDTKGLYTYSSPIIENILGYKPDEIVGKKYFYDLFEPESRESLKKGAFEIFSKKQKINNLLNINLHKSGKFVVLETNGVPILDQNGDLIGYRGADVDVTEKIKIQEALKDSEERYNALFDRSFDIVFIHDFEGKFVDCNKTGLNLFGYTREDIPNVKFPDLLEGEYLTKAITALEDLLKTGSQKESQEFRARSKDGRYFYLETKSSLILKDGKPVAVQGVARDITERKNIENKLFENERFLDSIIENIPDALFVKDAEEHRFLKINKAAETLFGFPEEQLLGKNDYDFFPKEDADFYVSKDNEVLNSRQMLDIPEETIHSGSLAIRFLHTKKIPICDAQGNPLYLLGIAEDITERKKLEEELHLTHSSIEKVSDAVVWLDRKGCFVNANETVCKLLNVSKEIVLKMSVKDFVKDFSIDVWNQFWDTSKLKKSFLTEYTVELIPGKPVELEVLINYIEYGSKEYLMVFARDVSVRNKMQQKLNLSELNYRTLIEGMNEGLLKVNRNEEFLFVNNQLCNMVGYTRDELIGKTSFETILRYEDRELINEKNEKRYQGYSDKYELQFIHKSGNLIWVDISSSPAYDLEGNITGSISVITNVTERKKSEMELKKLSTAVEQSFSSILITDAQGTIIYANPFLLKLTGFTHEDIIGKNPRMFQAGKTSVETYQHMWKTILSGNEWRGEILNRKKNGDLYWEYSSISPIKNEYGEITNFLAIKEDITEQKIKDEKLKESLKEKEIMLREIHHRVKNNLQIISSLLKLQSSYIKDPEVVEYFNVSQYRIKSMALIHQQLYRSDSLNKIDFQEYLSTLSKDILSIYFQRGKKIEINVESENVYFGIDTAIPCGLLISELLSNSLKHAFTERNNGKIELKVSPKDGNKYNLIFRDDGVGLPGNFNFQHPDSLGIELIHSLVEQLDGTVEIKNETGTEYNINFTELAYKKRM